MKNENGAYAIDESLLENGLNELEDREYQGLLDQLKMIMIQFINNLDLHEVFFAHVVVYPIPPPQG